MAAVRYPRHVVSLPHWVKKMAKSTIWISYDLGIQGDYQSLYAWLDSHSAKECGDSLAVLQYEYRNDLISELKDDIGKAISVDKRTRIYVIYRDKADKQKNKGKFIFGNRRTPPWAGCAPTGDGDEDVEA